MPYSMLQIQHRQLLLAKGFPIGISLSPSNSYKLNRIIGIIYYNLSSVNMTCKQHFSMIYCKLYFYVKKRDESYGFC